MVDAKDVYRDKMGEVIGKSNEGPSFLSLKVVHADGFLNSEVGLNQLCAGPICGRRGLS